MLEPQQIFCDRYQLTQCLANNAGRQTWLATDLISSQNTSVIVKLDLNSSVDGIFASGLSVLSPLYSNA